MKQSFPPAFLSFLLNAGSYSDQSATGDHRSDHAGQPVAVVMDEPPAPLFSPRERLILNCLIEGDSTNASPESWISPRRP